MRRRRAENCALELRWCAAIARAAPGRSRSPLAAGGRGWVRRAGDERPPAEIGSRDARRARAGGGGSGGSGRGGTLSFVGAGIAGRRHQRWCRAWGDPLRAGLGGNTGSRLTHAPLAVHTPRAVSPRAVSPESPRADCLARSPSRPPGGPWLPTAALCGGGAGASGAPAIPPQKSREGEATLPPGTPPVPRSLPKACGARFAWVVIVVTAGETCVRSHSSVSICPF